MADDARRYLVMLSASPATPERMRSIVSNLLVMLTKLSIDEPLLAFRSMGADYFGYFIKAKKFNSHQIRSLIESPGRWRARPDESQVMPFLSGDDQLMVLEIGQDFSTSQGFARQSAWLQHH